MLVQTYANRHPIVSCPLVWGAFSVDCFNFSSMLNNVSRDSNFLMTCWWQQRQQLCLYPPSGTSHSCFKPVCLVNWYCSIGPDHRHKFGWHVQHVVFSFVDGSNMLRHRPCHNFVWQSHNVFCGKKIIPFVQMFLVQLVLLLSAARLIFFHSVCSILWGIL